MKIVIQRFGEGPMTLSEFADWHNLTMVVKEYSRCADGPRYSAAFSNIEVVGDAGSLRHVTGEGSSPEAAIVRYAAQIAGRRLTRDAGQTEFQAPNAWLSEPTPPSATSLACAPAPLPSVLPAGTWIRGTLGPMQTYRECFLAHDSKGPLYCGGEGSAYLCFTPDRVHWLALTSDEERQRIARIEADYQSLGTKGIPSTRSTT